MHSRQWAEAIRARGTNGVIVTRVLGVIGYPIGHSVSPQMHAAALAAMGLDYAYHAFEVHPEHLGEAVQALRALNLAGLNVTIPHKQAVMPFLDEVTPAARAIGAVNTIVNQDGRLVGHNTDWEGFLRALGDEGVSPAGAECLVIGAGGVGRAVCYALAHAGAHVHVWDIVGEWSRALVRDLGGNRIRVVPDLRAGGALSTCDLLVNCTPVGMAPDVNADPPVDPGAIRPGAHVCDVIYNPLETVLLARARDRGCRASNGVGMLAWQGALALELWTGRPGPVQVMKEAVESAVRAKSAE
jgi:shikimate dehydrogenase